MLKLLSGGVLELCWEHFSVSVWLSSVLQGVMACTHKVRLQNITLNFYLTINSQHYESHNHCYWCSSNMPLLLKYHVKLLQLQFLLKSVRKSTKSWGKDQGEKGKDRVNLKTNQGLSPPGTWAKIRPWAGGARPLFSNSWVIVVLLLWRRW